MLKPRQINADPDRPTLRSTVAAATEPVREAAFAVEKKVVWPGAERLRRVGEVVRWPLERAVWPVERILWPLRERTAGLAPTTRLPGGTITAAGAILAGVALLAVVFVAGGGGTDRPVVVGAAPTAKTEVAAPPSEATAGPVLHGLPPSFGVGAGGGVARGSGGVAGTDLAAVDAGAATGEGSEGASASASSANEQPVPAGPAAMKVARRFSQAFVYYEVGRRPAQARAVFSETASARLARSLAKRPPRLPANTKVPRARVVNLVPGPRRGKDYTVSVSLLRVGLTSELRLSLRAAADGEWEVTEILG
jgi:hypothetical protein